MRSPRRGLVLAAALVAAAACSGEDRGAELRPRSEGEGCGAPTLVAGPQTIEVGGVERHWHLSLPAELEGPAPVIVDLHGLGGSAVSQEALGGVATAGVARGFVVATPESARPDRGWGIPTVVGGDADADLVDALLDELEAGLCVDPGREFATGASNGAALAMALVCALDGRLAGVAAVAGVNVVAPCDDAEPTTIVAFHGTSDLAVPYDGGLLFRGDADQPSELAQALASIEVPSVEEAVTGWAERFGCGPGADTVVASDVHRRTYAGCPEGVRVELYRIEGGGHTWPGGFPIPALGTTTTSIRATDLILDAFSAP